MTRLSITIGPAKSMSIAVTTVAGTINARNLLVFGPLLFLLQNRFIPGMGRFNAINFGLLSVGYGTSDGYLRCECPGGSDSSDDLLLLTAVTL